MRRFQSYVHNAVRRSVQAAQLLLACCQQDIGVAAACARLKSWASGAERACQQETHTAPPTVVHLFAQLARDVRYYHAATLEEEDRADVVILASRLAGVGYDVTIRAALGNCSGCESRGSSLTMSTKEQPRPSSSI